MNPAEHLTAILPAGGRLNFGELLLRRDADGRFSACHVQDDPDNESLETVDSVRELRDLAKFDTEGNYRPLKTAPGLRSGWITATPDAREFLQRLDAIYPGLVATWIAFQSGDLATVPLRETLDRQTGMYRFAGSITDGMADRIVSELCGAGCLRRVLWPIERGAATREFHPDRGGIPLICTEACTFAVSRARELAKEAYEAQAAASSPD